LRFPALASQSGAFGFTAGMEWLATERIEVHQARGMAWGGEPNLLPELARLNRLLRNHPCFFDGAGLTRLSADDSPVLALRRVSWDRRDQCLVLVNLGPGSQEWSLDGALWAELGGPARDLPPDHAAWRLEAHYLALALAGWVCTLSPQRIVLGGGVMEQPHLFETIRRFKGMEREVVVLVELPTEGDRLDELLYVGLTRATTELVLIAPPVMDTIRCMTGSDVTPGG